MELNLIFNFVKISQTDNQFRCLQFKDAYVYVHRLLERPPFY